MTEKLIGRITLGTGATGSGVEFRGGEVEFFAFDAKAMSGQAGVTGTAADFAFRPSVIDIGHGPFPLAMPEAGCVSVRGYVYPWKRF